MVYFVEVEFVVCGFGIKFEPWYVDFFCGFVDDCLVSSLAGPFLTFIAVSSKTCSLKSFRVTETGVFFYP